MKHEIEFRHSSHRGTGSYVKDCVPWSWLNFFFKLHNLQTYLWVYGVPGKARLCAHRATLLRCLQILFYEMHTSITRCLRLWELGVSSLSLSLPSGKLSFKFTSLELGRYCARVTVYFITVVPAVSRGEILKFFKKAAESPSRG